MVHLTLLPQKEASAWHLNTSYVMVHRGKQSLLIKKREDLNTSYVMVHLMAHLEGAVPTEFKYILCYGSSRENR